MNVRRGAPWTLLARSQADRFAPRPPHLKRTSAGVPFAHKPPELFHVKPCGSVKKVVELASGGLPIMRLGPLLKHETGARMRDGRPQVGEGFKADSEKLGPKLGEVRASGPTGLQRRVEAARALERARVEAERVGAVRAFNAWTPEDVVKAGARVIEAALDKVEAGPSPPPRSGEGAVSPCRPSPLGKRGRGRPMKEGPVSRATAFRRRKREAAGK